MHVSVHRATKNMRPQRIDATVFKLEGLLLSISRTWDIMIHTCPVLPVHLYCTWRFEFLLNTGISRDSCCKEWNITIHKCWHAHRNATRTTRAHVQHVEIRVPAKYMEYHNSQMLARTLERYQNYPCNCTEFGDLNSC